MKKLLLILLTAVFFSVPSFSQIKSIKDYPLKNYVAPEIEYRWMNLGTGLSTNGSNAFEKDAVNNDMNFNFSLYYYEYLNLARVQRIEYSDLYTGYSSRYDKKDSVKRSLSYLSTQLNYVTQTRLYRKKERFWGIHGYLRYYIVPEGNKEESKEKAKKLYQVFDITPFLSYGKGRIQPVESARQAMDILIALEKYNRLAVTPDKSMIDSLAHVANRIRYKRFFDRRFKTIYQLEELDKALQGMGLIDTADMVYFANLNDIWNFAPTYNRGTGIRYEGGLIPRFYAWTTKTDDPNVSEEKKDQRMEYGGFGFFSFNRMRPMSYAWQSDLMIDLTTGYDVSRRKTDNNDDVTKTNSGYFRSMLNASWQFGYFPNTRTFAGITPYAGLTYTAEKDADKTFGINTGFRISSYYYISPRLRLYFTASFYYVKDFDDKVPTPFWNTVVYSDRSLYRKTNDIIPFPLEARTYVNNAINYDFSFSLRYALF